MTKLHHPNIVQFLGYVDNPFIIVMEYIPNNNLYKNIINLKKCEKINIMKDILRGLAYIHNRRPNTLIHRDIKPTNILLTNSKVAKITDFGLSRFYNMEKQSSYNNLTNLDNSNNNFNENPENSFSTLVGTERYMAPEILYNFNNYTNKVDIYSCGILLYELFENKRHIINNKLKWFWTPKKIKNIILNDMLCKNPNQRKDALYILKFMNYQNI
tara:strand:- start:79 stop:720 length:642 start_codon:yes stop_codon:yes gene_type:complete